MPAAAQRLTGEVLLGQLTDRILAVYGQALECEEESFELRSVQRLIVAMAQKVDRDFSELVTLLDHRDRFLSFWAGYEGKPLPGQAPDEENPFELGFEDELENMIALVGSKGVLAPAEVVSRVKGLVLAFTRMVKKMYGAERAAVISAKMREFESRRMAVGRR